MDPTGSGSATLLSGQDFERVVTRIQFYSDGPRPARLHLQVDRQQEVHFHRRDRGRLLRAHRERTSR
jgi:hypothetical protein